MAEQQNQNQNQNKAAAAGAVKKVAPTMAFFDSFCQQLISASSTKKDQVSIIRNMVKRYGGDLALLFDLLLPKYNHKRNYFIQDKKIISHFADVFGCTERDLREPLEQGDNAGNIARVISNAFKNPQASSPSKMTIPDFNNFLQRLADSAESTSQIRVIKDFLKVATKQDLFWFVREIKKDLQLNANKATFLDGLHPQAQNVYKAVADIGLVIKRCFGQEEEIDFNAKLDSEVALGVPIDPMLAVARNDMSKVIDGCTGVGGILCYSETKYDGERLQLHKDGNKFHYFARSRKPMDAKKYAGLEDFVKQAVVADKIVLDSEILLYDKGSKEPLPFGTLGTHKKEQFEDAHVAIYIFDILFIDGEDLMGKSMYERRELLKKHVKVIEGRIMFSDARIIFQDTNTRLKMTRQLRAHMNKAMSLGLEGLVVKDASGVYEPGARHWVKLKKGAGAMADTTDLVVLGAFFGRGTRGGQLATLLLGCMDKRDPRKGSHSPGIWKTVTKAGNGMKAAQLRQITAHFLGGKRMSPCRSRDQLPAWIDSNLVPDLIVDNPDDSWVVEVKGCDFTKSDTHTFGFSLRFPRIEKFRLDKDVRNHNDYEVVKNLVQVSQERQKEEKEKEKKIYQDVNFNDLEPSDEDDDAHLPPKEEDAFSGGGRAGGVRHKKPDAADLAAVHARQARTIAGVKVPGFVADIHRNQNRKQDDDDEQQDQNQQRQHHHQQRRVERPKIDPTAALRNLPEKGDGTFLVRIHDVASPVLLRNFMPDRKNLVIVHCVATNGKWLSRGVMGALSNKFGNEPEEAYNETSQQAKMGGVVFSEIEQQQQQQQQKRKDNTNNNDNADEDENEEQERTTYVGSMYVLPPISYSTNSQVDTNALDAVCTKVKKYASQHQAQIHFALPDANVVEDWNEIGKVLLKHFGPHPRQELILYARGDRRSQEGHPLTRFRKNRAGAGGGGGGSSSATAAASGGGEQSFLLQQQQQQQRQFTSDRGAQDFLREVTIALQPCDDPKGKLAAKLQMMGATVVTMEKKSNNNQNDQDGAQKQGLNVPNQCNYLLHVPNFSASLKPKNTTSSSVSGVSAATNNNNNNNNNKDQDDDEDEEEEEQLTNDDFSSRPLHPLQIVSPFWVDACYRENRCCPARVILHHPEQNPNLPPDVLQQRRQQLQQQQQQRQQSGSAWSLQSKQSSSASQLSLSDLRIVLDRDALGEDQCNEIMNLVVTQLGATIQPRIRAFGSDKTTHFISKKNLTDEARKALDVGVIAVTPEWVRECAFRRVLCDPPSFRCGGAVARTTTETSSEKQTMRRERTPEFKEFFDDEHRRNEALIIGRSRNSNLLQGWTIHVSGYRPGTMESLSSAIEQCNGTVVETASSSNNNNSKSIIIADTLSTEVHGVLTNSNLISNPASKMRVVSRCWLDESLEAGRILDLDPFTYSFSPQTGFHAPFQDKRPIVIPQAAAAAAATTTTENSNNNNRNLDDDDDDEVTADWEEEDNNNTFDDDDDNNIINKKSADDYFDTDEDLKTEQGDNDNSNNNDDDDDDETDVDTEVNTEVDEDEDFDQDSNYCGTPRNEEEEGEGSSSNHKCLVNYRIAIVDAGSHKKLCNLAAYCGADVLTFDDALLESLEDQQEAGQEQEQEGEGEETAVGQEKKYVVVASNALGGAEGVRRIQLLRSSSSNQSKSKWIDAPVVRAEWMWRCRALNHDLPSCDFLDFDDDE